MAVGARPWAHPALTMCRGLEGPLGSSPLLGDCPVGFCVAGNCYDSLGTCVLLRRDGSCRHGSFREAHLPRSRSGCLLTSGASSGERVRNPWCLMRTLVAEGCLMTFLTACGSANFAPGSPSPAGTSSPTPTPTATPMPTTTPICPTPVIPPLDCAPGQPYSCGQTRNGCQVCHCCFEFVGGCCDFQGRRPCYPLIIGQDAARCMYTDHGQPVGCPEPIICNQSTGLCELQ